MKKTVFAAQVFGLLAIVPIIVILEMNHVPGSSTETNTSVAKEKTERIITSLPEKQIDKMAHKTFSISFEIFL